MKTSSNVFRRSLSTSGVLQKKTLVLKIVCYKPRKWPETDVFAKTHLQTLLARRHTPGAIMHLTMVGLWRRDRQSDEMHHSGFRLGK
jgi:hypothetical protein